MESFVNHILYLHCFLVMVEVNLFKANLIQRDSLGKSRLAVTEIGVWFSAKLPKQFSIEKIPCHIMYVLYRTGSENVSPARSLIPSIEFKLKSKMLRTVSELVLLPNA